MRPILLFCLLIIFSACSSNAPTPVYKAKVLPSWYLNPPSNTSEYLYGIGEGKGLKQARTNALETMLSQLGVSISSSYQSKIQSRGVYYQHLTKDVSYSLKEEISKTHISNYRLMQSHQQAYNHFIVLVRSNKKDFIEGLSKTHTHEIQKVQTDLLNYKDANVMLRYHIYSQSLNTLKDLLPNTLMLSTLDKNFDDKPYLKTLSSVDKTFQDLKRSMTFSLVSDSNSRAYRQEIQVALNKKGINLVNSARNNKNHLRISLHTSAQYTQTEGFNIAKTVLLIEIKDFMNNIIAGNKIRLTGQATQNRALALENSSKKLKKIISKTDISDILGLKKIF